MFNAKSLNEIGNFGYSFVDLNTQTIIIWNCSILLYAVQNFQPFPSFLFDQKALKLSEELHVIQLDFFIKSDC